MREALEAALAIAPRVEGDARKEALEDAARICDRFAESIRAQLATTRLGFGFHSWAANQTEKANAFESAAAAIRSAPPARGTPSPERRSDASAPRDASSDVVPFTREMRSFIEILGRSMPRNGWTSSENLNYRALFNAAFPEPTP